MQAHERRERLLAEMRNQGVDALIAFGTSWQEAHLRYVADFATLEGSAIAILTADGRCWLMLDSVAEAERAGGETANVEVSFVRDVGRAAGERLDKISNQKLAAVQRSLLPPFLTSGERKFRLEDGARLLDKLLMEKMPAEIAAIRRAVKLADEGYAYFRDTAAKAGRKQYEVMADVEAFLRSKGSPDNFMIMGSGGVDVRGMTPPSERVLKIGDNVITELTPSVDGYFAQICRTLVLGKATETQKRAFNV
jgi:Xaa-Pro aminopeptidase